MLKLNNTLYMFIDCVNHSQSQSQMYQDLSLNTPWFIRYTRNFQKNVRSKHRMVMYGYVLLRYICLFLNSTLRY